MESVYSAIRVYVLNTPQRYHVILNPCMGIHGGGIRSSWVSKIVELEYELLVGRDWVSSSP